MLKTRFPLILTTALLVACGGEGEPPAPPVTTPVPVSPQGAAAPPSSAPGAAASPTPAAPAPPSPSRSAARSTPRAMAPARSAPSAPVGRRSALPRGHSVHLRKPARLGDVRLEPGRYDVRLASGSQGMSIELLRDGTSIVRELATRPATQPKHDNSAAWLWHDQRHESMYRIYAQHGRDLYFITLPITG